MSKDKSHFVYWDLVNQASNGYYSRGNQGRLQTVMSVNNPYNISLTTPHWNRSTNRKSENQLCALYHGDIAFGDMTPGAQRRFFEIKDAWYDNRDGFTGAPATYNNLNHFFQYNGRGYHG